ncbi:hypothetical protein BDV10DRAFT_28836 [Aspergillus recurvatus]
MMEIHFDRETGKSKPARTHRCFAPSLAVLDHFRFDPAMPREQPPEITLAFINRTVRVVSSTQEITLTPSDISTTHHNPLNRFGSDTICRATVHRAADRHICRCSRCWFETQNVSSAHSTIIEILPPYLHHKGFCNVAALLGHLCFSAHASPGTPSKLGDWRESDVFIEQERLMDVVSVAIFFMCSRGS